MTAANEMVPQRPPGAEEWDQIDTLRVCGHDYIAKKHYAALAAYTKRVEAERDSHLEAGLRYQADADVSRRLLGEATAERDALSERYDEIHYEWENACDRERSALAERDEWWQCALERGSRLAVAEMERDAAIALTERRPLSVVHEDELPEDMSEEEYHAWFLMSWVDGVRMGPRPPCMRAKP